MFLLMLGALTVSCTKEYDDTELRSRIENLEEWQKTVNTDIATLKTLVSNLENKDYVTSVEPLSDGSGYVINFEKSGAVTIKHGTNGTNGANGKDGNTPVVSAKKHTDGMYYWTVDGEWLLNDENQKIPLTGEKGDTGTDGDDGQGGTDGEDGTDGKDAIAPKLRINSSTNEWEISTDNGATWTSTGVKATGDKGDTGATGSAGTDGDSMFKGVDDSHPDYVVITLNDATSTEIRLPRYNNSVIVFNQTGTSELIVAQGKQDVNITINGDNVSAVYATMAASGTSVTPTRAATAVGDGLPITKVSDGQFKITLTADDVAATAKGVIRVTAILDNGDEVSKSVYYEVAATGTIVGTTSADVKAALDTEATTDDTDPMSVVYTGDSSEEIPETKLEITIPDAIATTTNKKEQPLTIDIKSTDIEDVTLAAPEGYTGDITITVPKGVKVKSVISAPGSTVTITDGVYSEIIAGTAANTLIVKADVEIDVLIVEEGNVEIYGKVGRVVRHADNTDENTIVKVFEGGSVTEFGYGVTRYVAVTSVAVSETVITIEEQQSKTLVATIAPENATIKGVVWSSSDNNIATVDPATGVVTAVAEGEVTITATTDDGNETATCTVTVTPAPVALEQLKLPATHKMLIDEVSDKSLEVTYIPENAHNKEVYWSSTKSSIVEIDRNTGIMTAKAEGTATILVFTPDETIVGRCDVTVTEEIGFAVGDLYPDATNPIGVVFEVNAEGTSGKVVNFVHQSHQMFYNYIAGNIDAEPNTRIPTGVNSSESDGMFNTRAAWNSFGEQDMLYHPFFGPIHRLNKKQNNSFNAESAYTVGNKGVWYLPAKDESIILNNLWDSDLVPKLESIAYLLDPPAHEYDFVNPDLKPSATSTYGTNHAGPGGSVGYWVEYVNNDPNQEYIFYYPMSNFDTMSVRVVMIF